MTKLSDISSLKTGTLIKVLEQIRGWAEGNIEAVLASQKVFDSVEPDVGNRIAAGKVVRLASRRR